MKNKIRNYQIQTRLGSGSYGVIFKAINKNDKQPCVLKQIRMNKMSQKAKKSTLNEATIMGKLIHPFIVQYKQSFVEDDTLHIVMQYCDNGDLSMYLKMQNKKPLKQQKIWKFFIQICLGLEYIHKNKILHRDIKTLNIFLNKNQDIKIGDLGVAKMLMANDFAQTIVGTPFYLSPELCQQKPYNEKSDIWAMGCLLYELCTFRHPFQAANQASLILKIIRGKYSPIPEFYSKQLKDVIDMCLERDYKRRPTASMLIQRAKIKQYVKEFKLEEKVKQEYEKIKSNKENKYLQNSQNVQAPKPPIVKPAQKKVVETPQPPKPVHEVKKQANNNAKVVSPIQNANRKVSAEKKQQSSNEKRPTVSGMPEENIILPDKNNIIEKLKPSNNPVLPPKQQVKSPVPTPLLKQHQSHRKIKQNKEQFLKNLQKVIDHNVNLKRSPIKDKPKTHQEVSTLAVLQQKNRLEKIDMKIQQQLKKQQEIQKLKAQNQRKKSQTPALSNRHEEKNLLGADRRSVPALVSKESGKEISRYQSNHVKQVENPLIPPLPPKNKQQIIKVKMQQPPIPPKVYESNKSSDQKSKGIIKSKGFSQELKEDNNSANKIQDRKSNDFKRKSVQNVAKPVLFGLDEQERDQNEAVENNGVEKKSSCDSAKPSQYHSEKNIKIVSQMPSSVARGEPKKQTQRYLFKKKPQASVLINPGSNSRVRNKGNSNYNDLSRNAKNASKHSEVTKQDEDVVMNLPDSLRHNNDDSSDDQLYQNHNELKMNRNFQLKDINDSTVLQKYEEIINSKSSIANSVKSSSKVQNKPFQMPSHETQILKSSKKYQVPPKRISKNLNEYDEDDAYVKPQEKYFIPQQKVDYLEIDRMIMEPSICLQKQNEKLEFIPENESLAFKTQRYDDDSDQILDESQEMIDCEEKEIQGDAEYHPSGIDEEIYEINNFNLEEEMRQEDNGLTSEAYQSYDSAQYNTNTNNQQWQFDQQPELPMLEDKESPFFEQANPYLVPQQQEQTIQEKRNYLQIRLQQNIKREDQINKLMQIKIQQCRSAVPKYFDQIIEFFRKKINKQDQYTENDEKQVEEFLRKKGLTDQRKFQNIYKIMHFEMELENTQKIIQRICKKLSDLDSNQDQD